jgi:hypothetical protein
MRASYAIALVAAVLLGFGAKLFFFSAPTAVASVGPAVTIDPSEIQRHITNIPVHDYYDRSFVFSQPTRY